jgi:hypothetical protein
MDTVSLIAGALIAALVGGSAGFLFFRGPPLPPGPDAADG